MVSDTACLSFHCITYELDVDSKKDTVIAHRAPPVSFLLFLSEQKRQQVDSAKDNDPHQVNKVPVHLCSLYGKVLLLSEVTTYGPNQTDQQEDYADCHVEAMEAS